MDSVPGHHVEGASSERSSRQPARRGEVDGRAAIGLTGGVASGKSLALQSFRRLGARVLSADEVVHALYERPEMKLALSARFGRRVLRADGGVDRAALATAIGGDEGRMGALEALVHPRVAVEVEAFVKAGPPGGVSVCEIPLLFETGAERHFDLVVTIEAATDVRRARAAQRSHQIDFDFFDSRLAGREARSAAADMVFVNDGDPADLEAFVAAVFLRGALIASGELWRVLSGE